MPHYINKDALVAEINKLRKTSLEYGYTTMSKVLADTGKDLALGQLLHNIDTLEVKEVDDESECKIFPRPIGCYSTCKECPLLATNNKAQKGE